MLIHGNTFSFCDAISLEFRFSELVVVEMNDDHCVRKHVARSASLEGSAGIGAGVAGNNPVALLFIPNKGLINQRH